MSTPNPKTFAFPSDFAILKEGQKVHQNGIDKSGFFTAHALQGLLANPSVVARDPQTGKLTGLAQAVEHAEEVGRMIAASFRD